MKKLTPVFVVDRIEPCLVFWVDKLGFEKTVEVMEGNSPGFVILNRGAVEIMYQSRESLEKDMPSVAELFQAAKSPAAIYIEVSSLDDVLERLAGWSQVVPRRTTFYGAIEFGVREPAGNVIMFAQQTATGDP